MDAFIEYIEQKIKENREKRDAVIMPTVIPSDSWEKIIDHFEQLRVWWCFEARRQAYEDSLIQYKLTRAAAKAARSEKGGKI